MCFLRNLEIRTASLLKKRNQRYPMRWRRANGWGRIGEGMLPRGAGSMEEKRTKTKSGPNYSEYNVSFPSSFRCSSSQNIRRFCEEQMNLSQESSQDSKMPRSSMHNCQNIPTVQPWTSWDVVFSSRIVQADCKYNGNASCTESEMTCTPLRRKTQCCRRSVFLTDWIRSPKTASD